MVAGTQVRAPGLMDQAQRAVVHANADFVAAAGLGLLLDVVARTHRADGRQGAGLGTAVYLPGRLDHATVGAGPPHSLMRRDRRWKIVLYVRALQRSQTALTKDVPADKRQSIR